MADNSDPPVYFWPYDIFGYLLPGMIVVAPLTQFHSGVRDVIVGRYQSESIPDNVVLVILCYIVGHLVASLSSSVLERGFLQLTFGYPVTQMFCGYYSGPIPRRFLACATDIYTWPIAERLKNHRYTSWIYSVIRITCNAMKRRLDVLPGYVHPYDNGFVECVKRRYAELFSTTHDDWSVNRRTHDLFWVAQAYVTESMPRVYRSAMHFVELYGFSRNASMAFGIVALYPLFPQWEVTICCGLEIQKLHWSACCLMASMGLYVNFAKLLRRRVPLSTEAWHPNEG